MASSKAPLKSNNAEALVRKLLNLVSIKGEDILLSAQSEETLKFHRLRASLPKPLAVAHGVWMEMERLQRTYQCSRVEGSALRRRMVHLTDSLVCLYTLTRGRTSSRKLRRTLARINALLLLSNNIAVWAYVHTALNPADAPSRGHFKRKWLHG